MKVWFFCDISYLMKTGLDKPNNMMVKINNQIKNYTKILSSRIDIEWNGKINRNINQLKLSVPIAVTVYKKG